MKIEDSRIGGYQKILLAMVGFDTAENEPSKIWAMKIEVEGSVNNKNNLLLLPTIYSPAYPLGGGGGAEVRGGGGMLAGGCGMAARDGGAP